MKNFLLLINWQWFFAWSGLRIVCINWETVNFVFGYLNVIIYVYAVYFALETRH